MSTTRKDLELIAYHINTALLVGTITEREAETFVDVIVPALQVTTGLNGNGNRKFKEDVFREAALG